jgi:hypothetical protein
MADIDKDAKSDAHTETTPLLVDIEKNDKKGAEPELLVHHHVEQHVQNNHNRRFLIICLLLLTLVLGGVWSVRHIEGWQIITSLYVVVQIVTTIGYGDFTVKSDSMKLFCAFYVLLIWVFGAYAFNHAFAWVQTRTITVTRRRLKVLKKRAEDARTSFKEKLSSGSTPTKSGESDGKEDPVSARSGGTSTSGKSSVEQVEVNENVSNVGEITDYAEFAAATVLAICAIAFGTIFYALVESCTCSYGASHISDCKDDTYELCVETGGYQKNWITSFYMSVITLTTVGFGDHSPRSLVGRIVGILWMLIGVGFMAKWFSTLAKLFFDYEQNKRLKVTQDLSQELFKQIDKDSSGSLSRYEFAHYFLVHSGLITQKDLDEIDKHFDRLRNADDVVTWDDVKHHI